MRTKKYLGKPAVLNSAAVSDEAKAAIDGMVSGFEHHEQVCGLRTNKRRRLGRAKLQHALSSFVADLLISAGQSEDGGWVYRSMMESSFTREAVGYKTFRTVVGIMTTLRYVEAHEDNEIRGKGKNVASRWKATGALLSLLSAKGITPATAADHFAQQLPKQPVKVRASSQGQGPGKTRGKLMRLPALEATAKALNDLTRLNAFMDGIAIEGANHRGWERIFNEGTHPSFEMDRGGRLYSKCPGSYQSKTKAERSLITMGGEPVVEIDVRSSFMVILHGVAGQPFDPSDDAYDLTGFMPTKASAVPPRWLVKDLAVTTIGYGRHWRCWPRPVIAKYLDKTGGVLGKDFPLRLIRQAFIAKHPMLEDIWSLGFSWSTLMYRESEAIIGAMLMLMDEHSAPSLSVHDSLIVRASDREVAEKALKRSYREQCGIEPYVE